METHEVKTPMRDVFLRTVAVLGLIAVLLLGAWGIIQLAVSIPSLFGNLGGGVSNIFTKAPAKETLLVSAASNISSGQTLQVTWTHNNKDGEYSYAISYACANGLSLKAPLPTGTYQTIACNTAFNFVNAGGRMTVIPTLSGTTNTPLTISVSATKLSTGAVTAQGSATALVAPAAVPATATAVKTTPAKTTTTTKSNTASYYAAPVQQLYGYPDLAVQILSVIPQPNGLVAVKFQITNRGTNSAAGGWSFSAVLPINGSYNFMSQPQRALNPGDKMVYTLTYSAGYNNGYGYNTPYSGGSSYTGSSGYTCNGYTCSSNYNTPAYYGNSGSVSITADPQNVVWESNEQNNTAYAPAY